MSTVYRIVTESEWNEAKLTGEFRGSAHDLRDGFIHFSDGGQVAETARKYYAGARDLLLLFVSLEAVPEPGDWRWEESRNGALFPHLYGVLPTTAVHRCEPLPLDADGAHVLPELEP